MQRYGLFHTAQEIANLFCVFLVKKSEKSAKYAPFATPSLRKRVQRGRKIVGKQGRTKKNRNFVSACAAARRPPRRPEFYMNALKNKRVAYATLGCKLNFTETASMADRLAALGAYAAREDEQADICVVNTCSVTETAEQKCRQTISRLHRRHPKALIAVIGCYAQLQSEKLAAMKGVDLVLGQEEKGDLPQHLARMLEAKAESAATAAAGAPLSASSGPSAKDSRDLAAAGACHEAMASAAKDIRRFVPSCSRGERTRYFLKVQDGCNYYCTYCTIPFARGRSRNASVTELVESACQVAREGGREIIITGVNIGDFGQTTGETFFDLVRALDGVEGIERYRISSIEPNLLTDEIIDFCAESRAFMPHFHIPLQCGSDSVLRLMRRRYDTALFAEKVARVRRAMPDAFVGVDVIVGTRGETEALFEESFRFIRDLDIAQLHVFSYSERPGTKALDIPHSVSPAEKHERSQRLLALSKEKLRAFYNIYMGTERPVLWEHAAAGRPMRGFTDNYVRVELPAGAVRADGSVTSERLGPFTPDGETLTALV